MDQTICLAQVAEAPQDDVHASLAGQATCNFWLALGGAAQANEELEDNEAEWNHGKSQTHPAAGWIVLNLIWVNKAHHLCRGET